MVVGGRAANWNWCWCSCDSPPSTRSSSPPRAQQCNQGCDSISRGGGGGGVGEEGLLRADPEGRYIYLGNESPNSAARQGEGAGTRPSGAQRPTSAANAVPTLLIKLPSAWWSLRRRRLPRPPKCPLLIHERMPHVWLSLAREILSAHPTTPTDPHRSLYVWQHVLEKECWSPKSPP